MLDNYGVGICMLLCVGKGVLLLVIGLKLINGGVFIYIGCCWVLILCIWVDWKVWGVRCVGVDGYVWKCWFCLCNFGDWFECSGGNLVWEFVWICLFLEIDGYIVNDDVEEVGVFVGIEVDREFVVMGLFIVFLFFLFDLMLILLFNLFVILVEFLGLFGLYFFFMIFWGWEFLCLCLWIVIGVF